MSDIKVRQATAVEAGRIAEFNRKMALETEGLALNETTTMAGTVSLLGHPERGFYLVAECNGTLAGCLLVTYEWSDWRNKMFWWLGSFYVRPEFRGRGVYAALYAKVKELAAREGHVAGVRLYVHKDNLQAQQIYRGLGMMEKDYRVYEDIF